MCAQSRLLRFTHPPSVPQFPLFLSMRWWSCVVSCFRLLFIFLHFLLQNWLLLKFGSLCIRVKSRKLVDTCAISHLATFYWFIAVHRETWALLYFLSLDFRSPFITRNLCFSLACPKCDVFLPEADIFEAFELISGSSSNPRFLRSGLDYLLTLG